MTEVTATDAARQFADLLDAVEHDGAEFTILRRGRAVAHVGPVRRGRGSEANALFRRHRPDPTWSADLEAVRHLLEIDDRG